MVKALGSGINHHSQLADAMPSQTILSTWANFSAVLAAYQDGGFDGVGLCFGGEVVGIDLDDCFSDDGTLKPWADDLLCDDGGLAIPTYCEYSPSGGGLHLFYIGALPEVFHDRRTWKFSAHCGIEIYAYPSNKYFTLTGRVYGDAPQHVTIIAPVDLMPVYYYLQEIMPPKIEPPAQLSPQVETLRSDDDIIRIAGRAKNSAKVIALLRGDTSGYPSASEADAALCAILALLHAETPRRLIGFFERSGLYRGKWDVEHYEAAQPTGR